MKVLHLSSSDARGGAFSAASRLHSSLVAAGVDSRMYVGRKLGSDAFTYGPESQLEKLWSLVAPKLDRIPLKLAMYPSTPYRSMGLFGSGVARRLAETEWDILNLHWISGGFMTPKDVRLVATTPVVWRLADMWPMTGTEHYVGESLRYRDGYDKTQPIHTSGFFDLDRWAWNRKLMSWRLIDDLTVVAPSNWIASCARQSQLLGNRRIEVIPTGQDLEVFQPINRTDARRRLGLPINKRFVLFGAAGALTDKRKGFHYVGPALEYLKEKNQENDVELLVFGDRRSTEFKSLSGLRVHNLGLVENPETLAVIYAAADVFLAPSEEENLANTVIESMASGTPVVAFQVGGMPDMIKHQANGYLARPFNTLDLGAGLSWVIQSRERLDFLSKNARETAVAKFSLDSQKQNFMNLYADLLRKHR